MKPIDFEHSNKIYAKDQPEYQPLPALLLGGKDGQVVTCWKLSFKERLKVMVTGVVWLNLLSFNKPLTPSYMSVNRKDLFSIPDDKLTWGAHIKKLVTKKPKQ